jgi:hypothetical protein
MAGHTRGVREALFVENAPDVVRLVTIDADGYLVRLLFPELTLDDLQMDLFDLSVTLHASVGDVIAVDAGAGIFVRQNVMGGMTARANGGDDEASLEETITMDGLGVIFQNMTFVNGTELRDLGPLLVAGAAKGGDAHHISATSFVDSGKDIVLSVAARAVGGEISAFLESFSV